MLAYSSVNYRISHTDGEKHTVTFTMTRGEDFRNALRSSFDVNTYRHTFGIFEYVYRMFDQATQSFDTKSYDAVCLLCRSTVEAVCYLYLTRKKERVGRNVSGTLIDPPRTLDGVVRKTAFEELQRGIRQRKVLSDEQLNSLQRIKEDGDLIAHIAEKSDRIIWRSLRHDPNKDPYETLPSIGEGEASKDLEDTISIIATLANAAMKDSGARP